MRNEFHEIINFIRDVYHKPEGEIHLHEPVFIGNEIKYMKDCIDSTFVSSIGKYVNQFETRVADYTGSKYTVAAVNGTAALHVALRLTGVNNGDEVITQPLTFIATANAISYCNASPVFVDVDKDTMGLSPEKLADFLKNHVKYDRVTGRILNRKSSKYISAVVPMHTFGNPCHIQEIIEISGKYSLPVIEDAAESLGSKYKNQHTGTFGRIGVLSFNGNKIVTTGGGGMILTNDPQIAKLAKHVTTQAKIPHPWEFSHDQIGYNYRMPNINAALGVAQLEMIEEFVQNKRTTASLYKDFFQKRDILFISELEYCRSNYWLNAIKLRSREERDLFLEKTNSEGIMTRPVWTLMNKLPMYKNCLTGDLSNALEFERTIVNLPSGYRKQD